MISPRDLHQGKFSFQSVQRGLLHR